MDTHGKWTVALATLSLVISFSTSVTLYFFTRRRESFYKQIATSVALSREFSDSRGSNSHVWRVCNWMMTANDYVGLPFENGETKFFLNKDVYDYATGREIHGESMPPPIRYVVKAAMNNTCECLKDLLNLVERDLVDKEHLRPMVWALAGKMWQAKDSAWTIKFENVLRRLLVHFHLPINLVRQPGNWNKTYAAMNWDSYRVDRNWTIDVPPMHNVPYHGPRDPMPLPFTALELSALAAGSFSWGVDPLTNKRYYYNNVTRQCSWNMAA